eukprot:5220245-Ditylum_brightwellii.AAC.1
MEQKNKPHMTHFQKTLCWFRSSIHTNEPYKPWQNYANGTILLLYKQWRNRMAARKVPPCLWDYGIVYNS